MFDNFKELQNNLKKIKDLKHMLDENQDNDPIKLFQSLGIDTDNLDVEFANHMRFKVNLKYQNNSDNQDLKYHYPTDSGFDLRSNKKLTLGPLERDLVPTGIFLDIPEGYEIQVRPKSGLAIKKGLSVVNTPGTVDQGYTGEIQVILINLSNETHTIEVGDKIAQAVLCPVMSGQNVVLEKINKVQEKDRGDNGFGSTGN